MILTCPECNTRYAVPDNAIGTEGRTVRCRSCKHQWFQAGEKVELKAEPEVEVALEAKAESKDDFGDFLNIEEDTDNIDIPFNAELPSLQKPASQKSWMIASVLLVLCAIGILLFHSRDSFYPIAPGLYESVGYYPNNGVMLANVTIEKQKSRRKKRYEVGCILLNTSDTPQIQPPLAMRILSSGGNVLAEDDAYLPGGERMIEPGEHIDCGKLEVVHNFASADKLLLEIASPLEMGLRSGWNPNHDQVAAR